MDTKHLSVGQQLRDNDPRMKGRTIVVEKILPEAIVGRDGLGRSRRYLARRIHDDGKARKSGLSVLNEAATDRVKP